jgi:CheY-like chemotaxis protein
MNLSEWRMANIILLVEDNEDHAEMVKQSLGDEDVTKEIYWVKDGQEALDFVHNKGSHVNAPRPTLILLDLNLPKASGLEVLKVIKEDHDLKIIPVVMLTTSDRNEEILRCYQLGVNSFITKPVKFEDYLNKLKSLENYWLMTNREPSTGSH